MSSSGTTNRSVAGIPEKAVDETPRASFHHPEPPEPAEATRHPELSASAIQIQTAPAGSSDANESSNANEYVPDDDARNRSASESSSDSANGEKEESADADATDMFKRLRLRRASEGDDHERNEHGLVTRVRRSLHKHHATNAASKAPPAPPMFATVCINNVNRSMQAHVVLRDAGLRVTSFGAGVQVCFPGRSADTPRLFGFGTPYETMYNALRAEDEPLYRQNGVLAMLERNMQVKHKPQQFQHLLNKQLEALDVVVCLDYSMFIRVLNDLRMRIRFCFQKKRLHVICLEVEDTPQDALSGGALTLELCQELNALPELIDAEVKKTVVAFEKRHSLEMFYVGLSV